MDTLRFCPQCQQPLPANAPEGLCPQCLLRQAVGPEESGSAPTMLEGGSQPGSARAGDMLRYFGNYELIEEVGVGGMGVVWQARQASLNRIVALKMIRGGMLANAEEVKRFRAEAQAAANLQHPNIVAIHEIGEQDGQDYYSMDFIQGRSLHALCDGKPLEPERAAQLLATVAGAVEFAHRAHILHRDLKPHNVMMDADGVPHLTDFGLAKRMDVDSGMTQTGAIMGSPSYMAPEQAQGRNDAVGPRTDVYSLGAILYETLTGRPPFQAATALDTVRQVVDAEPAPPRSVNPSLPADLETICLKCLEKDPARRYASAQEFADELGRFLRHEPIKARPATRIYRLRKWVKRKPAIAALLGVIALTIVGVVAALLRHGETLREHSVALSERLHGTLIEQARAERLLGHRETALQRIADAAKIRHTPELRTEAILAIAQPGVRRVFDAPVGQLAYSRFSADDRLIAAAGEGFVPRGWPGFAVNAWRPFVRVWKVPSGRLVAAMPWHLDGGPFAFSPDSRWIAVPQSDEETHVADLALWDFKAGKVTARLPVSGASFFSPDGKFLAVQEAARVSVFANDAGGWKPVQGHGDAAAIVAWTAPDTLLLKQLLTKGHGRVFHWNVAADQKTFPLNDAPYLRPERWSPAEPLPGNKLDAETEEAIAFSADGSAAVTHKLMASREADELLIRDIATGKKLGSVRPVPFPDFAEERPPIHLLSEHGRRLIFPDAVEPGRMRVYDVTGGKYLIGVGEPDTFLAPPFERVLHGSSMGQGTSGSGADLMRWSGSYLTTRSSIRPTPEAPWISPIQNLNPDGALFAASVSGSDWGVTLWELDSGWRFATVPQASRPVWSADSRWLAVQTSGMIPYRDGSSQSGDIVQVNEVHHGVPTHRLGFAPQVLAFSPDGRQLAASKPSSGCVLWDVERKAGNMVLHATTNQFRDKQIVFAPNAVWVLNDPSYHLVGSLAQATPVGSQEKPFSMEDSGNVMARALSPDGNRLLIAIWTADTGQGHRHLQFWDLVEHKRLATWQYPSESNSFRHGPLVFSPDGRTVAFSLFSNMGIEIWNATTGKRIHQLQQPQPVPPPPPTASILPGFIRNIFGLNSGPPPAPKWVRTFQETSVQAIAFTPDSRLVISIAEERAVIREAQSGRELAQCRGTAKMLCVAVSPDGRMLATGDEDRQIRLWEIPSGRELAHWPAHDAAVTALAFSPDGTTLVSGGNEAALKLWNLPFIRRELAALGLDW